jgi:single-stranded DNA-binding protein
MENVTNYVKLAGNVVNDPKYICDEKNNFRVLNFTIVTIRQFIHNGRFTSDKSYHKISVRGKLANEYKEIIKKSIGISIEGYLRNRTVIKEGVRHPITEVAVDESGNIELMY